ncbi:phosphate starvation-inducible protein PhoH [Paenibacillus abyssi]|uniref:Glutamine amidotransferase domain-containing protein n=1 Tax=Paenibacillus abyssi TaxID=1340531 RepID=A0A917FRF5_9BACL|nr:phosphate starvation-inducible protein PhoH [Paenibacillus abyssi]GGF97691.1 hypothetical protein GCM10010916_13700 [Paenibacillus abyssi]
MCCYLRMHQVLAGVMIPKGEIDWDHVFSKWQTATTVADRDELLSTMELVPIDVYDLGKVDLSQFCGLIVSDRVDQDFLYQERDSIRKFLDAGKVVAFSGGLFREWLPGAQPFVSCEDGAITERALIVAQHPIFEGIKPEDMGNNFAYGYHPAPEGVEVLISHADGGAVVYVDRVSTGGVILVHTGHSLLGYGASEGPGRWIVPQLLSWFWKEAQQ